MKSTKDFNEVWDALANQLKGFDFELLSSRKQGVSVSLRNGKTESVDFSDRSILGIRVIINGLSGTAATEDWSSESLELTAKQAIAHAKTMDSHLKTNWVEIQSFEPMTDLYYQPTFDSKALIDLTLNEEKEALSFDERIKAVNLCWASTSESSITLKNSKGFMGEIKQAFSAHSCHVLTEEGSSVFDGTDWKLARKLSELKEWPVGKVAAQKALRRLGSQRPRSGSYRVVFSQDAACDFLSTIASFFSAQSFYEKTSPLLNQYNPRSGGKKIFSSKITIVDDPFFTAALGARPFDREGSPSRSTTIIDEGVLNAVLSDSTYANALGVPNTANAIGAPGEPIAVSPSNLLLLPGTCKKEDLLNAGPTIYINNLINLRGLNRINGDFSIPALGEWYENGEFKYSIKDFVISGNALTAFSEIEGIGELEARPLYRSSVSPPLAFPKLSIAGD